MCRSFPIGCCFWLLQMGKHPLVVYALCLVIIHLQIFAFVQATPLVELKYVSEHGSEVAEML